MNWKTEPKIGKGSSPIHHSYLLTYCFRYDIFDIWREHIPIQWILNEIFYTWLPLFIQSYKTSILIENEPRLILEKRQICFTITTPHSQDKLAILCQAWFGSHWPSKMWDFVFFTPILVIFYIFESWVLFTCSIRKFSAANMLLWGVLITSLISRDNLYFLR